MLVAVFEDLLMLDPKSSARAKNARDRQRRNDIERRSRRRRRARVEGLKAEVAMLEAVVTSLQLLDQETRATGEEGQANQAKEDEAREATLESSSARAYLCQETKRLLAERWQLQESFARHEGSVRAIQVILDDVERSTLEDMPSERPLDSASPISDILFEDLELESEASWGDLLE
ncbi:hypothetical protein P43SY_003205 [Pythium insidiosum]|uniref:BZIP domain-containing protein n=1 Tax=Pythium insidiosum TaxID=114742 RepID=A0AAD5Q7U8_PYTIN|nr:hypothetical protein P43SY_003205 [Pythium insidiosum]